MKKLFFCTLTLLVISSLRAQDPDLWMGVHATSTRSSFRGNQTIAKFHQARILYAFGMDFHFRKSKSWGLISGFEYERRGSKTEVELTDVNGNSLGPHKFRSNVDYLNIPLLVSFRILDKKVAMTGAMGTYMGILLQATSFVPSPSNVFITVRQNEYKNYGKIDAGLASALLLDVPVKETLVATFAIRDYFGLTTIDKSSEYGSNQMKTNSLGFQFGMMKRL